MRTLIDLITGVSLARDHGRGETLAGLAGVTEADRVLDIGCGPGNALAAAKTRGAAVIGLDPSPTMLWLAARRVPGAVLLASTVEAIPLPCDSVTVAWASGSFHHWPNAAAGLAEVRRVLAPGGRVFILERQARGRGFHAMHAIGHTRAEDLLAELGAAGFSDARLEAQQIGGADLFVVSARAELDRADDPVVV